MRQVPTLSLALAKRELLKKWHPDKNYSNPACRPAFAEFTSLPVLSVVCPSLVLLSVHERQLLWFSRRKRRPSVGRFRRCSNVACVEEAFFPCFFFPFVPGELLCRVSCNFHFYFFVLPTFDFVYHFQGQFVVRAPLPQVPTVPVLSP